MAFIEDIYTMDDIFAIEHSVQEKKSIKIPNVSYWDSSQKFQSQMAQVLELPVCSLPWDYYYTYSISKKERMQVLINLGVPSENLDSVIGLLLQSSTIAIVNMINLLVHQGKKKLCILQPSYFSVSECCKMLSLKYEAKNISFLNGNVELPVKEIINGGYDCVWITSPVFCTGKYFDQVQLNEILELREAGLTIIFDESLALPGKELVRFFHIDPQVFAIYSPHKAISINGLKFSVLVSDVCYEDFLEQWVDVFSGALASSNRDAVFHYISPNYSTECLSKYLSYIDNTKDEVVKVIKQFPFATTLPDTYGHYITVFTNRKLYGRKDLLQLMQSLISSSLASFIPGTLNGFSAEMGLCFRVNLTSDATELAGAVCRILTFLKDEFHGSM